MQPNPTTPKIEAYRRLNRAWTEFERARRELNAAIVQAIDVGWPNAVVARVMGMNERYLNNRLRLARNRDPDTTEVFTSSKVYERRARV